MADNVLFRFSKKRKDLPDIAKLSFLNTLKESILRNVEASLAGIPRAGLEIEANIKDNKIEVKIIDKRVKPTRKERQESEFFNSVSESEFLNVVTEDEFRSRVIDGAKRSTQDIERLILETEKIFK